MPAPWRTSLIIGNPENRRVPMWQAALRGSSRPESLVVSHEALLRGLVDLPALLRDVDVIRLDSPGENAQVERLLILRGATCTGRGEVCCEALTAALADRGRIVHPGLWAAGYRDLLADLQHHRSREGEAPAEPEDRSTLHPDCRFQGTPNERDKQSVEGDVPASTRDDRVQSIEDGSAGVSLSQTRFSRACRWLSDPAEVSLLFDKPSCQRRLAAAGIPVPRPLPAATGYEHLRHVLRAEGCSRVFVKLSGGSSASGVVALNASTRRISAVTSVERVSAADGVRLYNSLQIRRYEEQTRIASLIDALAGDGPLHVEEWVPKAGFDGRTFDLRIVMIGGEPQHMVMRTSRGPLTNLHLGNRRGDLTALRQAVPESTWRELLETCRQIAALFPGCLMLGIDLGLTPGFRRHFVIEVNAFGDLLPGVLHEGRDTYAAQVAAIG